MTQRIKRLIPKDKKAPPPYDGQLSWGCLPFKHATPTIGNTNFFWRLSGTLRNIASVERVHRLMFLHRSNLTARI